MTDSYEEKLRIYFKDILSKIDSHKPFFFFPPSYYSLNVDMHILYSFQQSEKKKTVNKDKKIREDYSIKISGCCHSA